MSDTPPRRMKVSREGIVLIKSFQGFRPRAVRDADGRWIIGYGHAASAREGLVVGEEDAELLLQYDLLPVARALNDHVSAELNQHQFDALASFAVSVGVDAFLASDVLARLNGEGAAAAAGALMAWPETPAPDAALRRRFAERALFMAPAGEPVSVSDLLMAPLEAPGEAAPGATGTDARAAAVAALLGEPVPQASARPATVPQRYSPYGATIVGPLPGFPPAAASAPPDSNQDAGGESRPGPREPAGSVEPSIESSPTDLAPFPVLDEGQLIVTPSGDEAFLEVDAPVPPVEAAFESGSAYEEPAGDAPVASVMRHEKPRETGRLDRGQTGMFFIIGGIGLVSCAFSAAAFRLAAERPSPMGETTVLAWALAIIGVITVTVSTWNLYARWDKPD